MKMHRFGSQRGQSTVEYVVIVTIFLTAFMAAPSVTKQLQTVFANKAESYAFAVSISDPPGSRADEKVHEVTDKIDKIYNFLNDFELPDDIKEKIPGYESVEKFIKKIKKLFN